MGDGAIALRATQCGDAAPLIGVDSRAQPGVGVRDPLGPASVGGRIEIGVEDAAGAAKLQLEALPLADLQGGRAQSLDEFACRHSDEVAAQLRRRPHRRRLRLRLLLRGSRAAGDEQGGESEKAAHGSLIGGAALVRHPRESGSPARIRTQVPAFAGMTVRVAGSVDPR